MQRIQDILKNLKDFSQQVGWFFVDAFGWCRSVVIYIGGIKHSRIFYGYGHYNWACKYADKRDRKWKPGWDQLGKLQGVLPIKERLIVCSRLELKSYQKRGIIKKNVSYNKIFKKANYHKSKNNYGNKK